MLFREKEQKGNGRTDWLRKAPGGVQGQHLCLPQRLLHQHQLAQWAQGDQELMMSNAVKFERSPDIRASVGWEAAQL